MPIADYKGYAQKAKISLLNSSKVSNINKECLEKFFRAYDVKPATILKFCRQVRPFVEHFDDVTKLLDEHLYCEDRKEHLKRKQEARDKVNQYFESIRTSHLSQATFATIVIVVGKFMRWLNDDEKPYSFKDVKYKKDVKRTNLKREDMIEKEERDLLIKNAPSIQFKAIIATQLDGGFRPSEFVDLKYGSVKLSNQAGIVIVNVKEGKTGTRDVCLYHATPYLMDWLEHHPTKKADDPLWIVEQPGKSNKDVNGLIKSYNKSKLYYTESGMRKRLKRLAQKLEIDKPVDFYALRHSACFLSKLENTPVEFAANKFGHDVDYYNKTYGRVDAEDRAQQAKKHVDKYMAEEDKQITCPVCKEINSPERKTCQRCHSPLTLTNALTQLQQKQEYEVKYKELESQMKQMQDTMRLIKEDIAIKINQNS